MIKVEIRFDDTMYNYISVKGHANYADKGEDLICASVSSIIFGLMNAIDMVDKKVDIEVKKNQIIIKNYSNNDKINNYFELAILQLKTIEESYSQYIKIDERRKQ